MKPSQATKEEFEAFKKEFKKEGIFVKRLKTNRRIKILFDKKSPTFAVAKTFLQYGELLEDNSGNKLRVVTAVEGLSINSLIFKPYIVEQV